MNKKVLIIVAHPDDETIWMGGTILANRNTWDTTIISLCRKDDPDRAPKFKRVCEEYNAKGYMSSLEDETLEDITITEVIKRIRPIIKKESFDYLFTHGKNGEYGHKRHINVNQSIKKMLADKSLVAKKIFFFSYLPKNKICYPNPKSDKLIYLQNTDFKHKKRIIQELYGFEKNSFEERCCQKIEAFNINKEK